MKPDAARLHIRVRGVVQGVGFRPFVWREATALGIAGSVRNDGAGVWIDAQGTRAALGALRQRLDAGPPPRARVDAIEWQECPPDPSLQGFAVVESRDSAMQTAIGHDTATCEACLAELFDPQDRRHRYALTNCTDCGPRYTVTESLPYDRARTSLAPFPLCDACRREYEDPRDRRFHAEAAACPDCGPALRLHGGMAGEDPITGALRLIRGGAIVAIKGLGGYHLACDATQADAVRSLRARKHREEQPFAIMVANLASLAPHASADPHEATLLASPERPIVLLRRTGAAGDLAGVADGFDRLGVLLPYTPVHFLLFHEAAGRPAGLGWLERPQPLVLVMTSANVHDEPLVTDDGEAREVLAGIADAWLVHDRRIVTRCDDSVIRVRDGVPRVLRRARGAAPRAIRLGRAGASLLGLGGHYKATACATRGDEAFLTPHVGDLDLAPTRRAFDAAVRHLLALTDVRPAAIAHDLHPDFHSTRLAMELAGQWGLPAVPVQHHHAHIGAVLAEHHHEGPVVGLALDGIGHGTDGQAWGGELLLVDGARCDRIGHLATLPLPGGDRAAREPWRLAAAALSALGRGAEIEMRFPRQRGAAVVARILAHDQAPRTSSLGRWFDAAAGLLGIVEVASYEAQAAMRLEALAAAGRTDAAATVVEADPRGVLDLLPLLEPLADAAAATRREAASAAFHASLAASLAAWVAAAAARHGVGVVACGGGCLQNDLLARALRQRLEMVGLRVLEAAAVPANDGGISLGQCWVAARSGRV